MIGIKYVHNFNKMGWIKERILSEYSKHGDRLDWAKIAEIKIFSELKEVIRYQKINDYGSLEDGLCENDINKLIKRLRDSLNQ